MSDRNAWDDIRSLAAAIGYEAFFEPRQVQPPPRFCEPTWYDPEWPPSEPMPDDVFMAGEICVCRVHDEYWPCSGVNDAHP